MLPLFASSRLKIARARQHIDSLRREVDSFLAREPFQIVVIERDDPHAPMFIWTVRIREPVPVDFSSIIGDAIHNLRTALDLLAADLAARNEKSSKGVYFPFAESERGLAEMIKHKNFGRTGELAVDLLKQIQPYRGGNWGLRAIHDLDVRDKHQALIPVAQSANIHIADMLPDTVSAEVKAKYKIWSTAIIEDGQSAIGLPKGWGPRPGAIIKTDYVLTLPIDEGKSSYALIGLLNEFARVVEEVVDAFARL